jgi:hypothetical protein
VKYVMTNEAFKTPDLDQVLLQINLDFDWLIDSAAKKPFREAVLACQDVNAPELRHWLSDNFLPSEITGAVGRDYAARAWIAFVQATQAHERGDASAAWYYVSEAQYQFGRMNADYVAMERIDRIRTAGRKGGLKAGIQRDPIKRECIHLLNLHRPTDGWISHDHAFDCIAAELIDFSAREGEDLTRDALRQKVKVWLIKDPDAKTAYEGKERQP